MKKSITVRSIVWWLLLPFAPEAWATAALAATPNFPQQAYLKASNANSLDRFGAAVAMSGDTVVVGADRESSVATGVDGNASDNSAGRSGAAYVFVRSGSTWTQQAYLKASNTEANDNFGVSVAISGDTIVVGASGESSKASSVNGDQSDNSASGSGAAYVFVRSGTVWRQQAYLKASNPDARDEFGSAVAISGDTVVVGAHNEASAATSINGDQRDNSALSAGAAYVFVRNGSNWSQQGYIKAANADAGDHFGLSLALSGNTLVVGAEAEDSNASGVNGNGSDNSLDTAGAAYVFVRMEGVWTQQAYLKAGSPDAKDSFGSSVGVSGDTVVVGANDEDSSATGINGNAQDNARAASGAAYVFVREGTKWTQQAYLKASNAEAGDRFGLGVAIDGDWVAVGAPRRDDAPADSGAAYLFQRKGTVWSQQAYLKASNPDAGDQFGRVLAVSGETVVVPADSEDSNGTGINGNQADNSASSSGAAYVFVPFRPCSTVDDPVGPFTDVSGPLKPFVVLRENEAALPGGQLMGTPSIVGFNDAGQLALQSVQTCPNVAAPGRNFLMRLSIPANGPIKELSSFIPEVERNYIGLGLKDDGGLISFDSFDSASNEDPPIVNGRIWQAGSFQLLPNRLDEMGQENAFGGVVKARGVSANGNFYLVAISTDGARKTMLLNGQGSALQSFPDVVPYAPIQISDAGQFLGAPVDDPDHIHLYQPGAPTIEVGKSVQHIRISRDGTAIARLDKLTTQTLSFVLRVLHPSGSVAATVINPSSLDGVVDPFETWRAAKNGVIQTAQIEGGVGRFLDVLAVQRLIRPLGDQIMTVLEAEDTQGVAGLYYIRSSAESGKVFASCRLPRIPGVSYADTPDHSAGSDAFLNRKGEILVRESLPVLNDQKVITGKSAAFSLYHANLFSKFKQGSYGSLLTGLASDPETRWFDQPVNPGLPAAARQKMSQVGCTLTAMAMIASYYGREISPLEVRDIMLALGAINERNQTSVSRFQLTVGNQTLKRAAAGGTFADIVSELRGGNAVLIKVPNKFSSAVAKTKVGVDDQGKDILAEAPPLEDGSYISNGKGHFIMAYGLNRSLAPDGVATAADVWIADPAYSYSGVYGKNYTAGEELIHVTLADYFGRIAADTNYVFDLHEWFDENRFHRVTGEIVHVDDAPQVQRWRIVQGPVPADPTLDVFSPVELAINANGKRYVSTQALAHPGDVVLQKTGPDIIGAFDEENDSGANEQEALDPFPPYTLFLPPELAGLSLNLEIVGIGTGSYKVVLNPAKPGFSAGSLLQGFTTTGQTNLARIEVVPATNSFTAWAASYPTLGTQNGFNDDPDDDGISNGYERFFGTHPMEPTAGLIPTVDSAVAQFQHPRSKFRATDVSSTYEWSTDLKTWHASGETVDGISVRFSESTKDHGVDIEMVTITPIIEGAPPAMFYRLRLGLIP